MLHPDAFLVLARPLPACFEEYCVCPMGYDYEELEDVCVPKEGYDLMTKGPSGFHCTNFLLGFKCFVAYLKGKIFFYLAFCMMQKNLHLKKFVQ